MANETVLVELTGGHAGMVVRLPPLAPTFSTYDLGPQARVQNAVAAAGVPAPAPALIVTDPGWIGSPFLVMPMVTGTIPGPAPLFDEWITGAAPEQQRAIHDGLIDTLARVHSVEWARADLGRVLVGPSLPDAVDHWAAYVAWAGEGKPLPALAEALAWCRRHQPPSEGDAAAVLLWGDVRLGNLVFDDDRRVHAVLDWDLAAIGPPEMDLGWYFGLEFMMEELFGRRVVGFPEKEDALARYETRSGHTVAHLDWHEVFALVRALAINDRHQRIARSPRRLDNPMSAVLLARMHAVRAGPG
jgi:aminoglycoside phosphotransferase (APT) family kinase protein